MAAVTGCPDLETLEAAAAGAAVAPEAERHLQRCDRCAQELAAIEENNAILGELAAHGIGFESAGDADETTQQPGALRVPGYRTTGVIACGGQGIVFRGVDETTGRDVAIKVLSGGAWASSRQRLRFEREMDIIARLRHPNIVALYETASIEDVGTALIMEFVEGATIGDSAGMSEGPHDQRELRERLRMFLKICDGISHAHRHGVIHRDIKPRNVIIDSDGEPRILDFGVAKLASGDSTVSVTGEFVGTLSCAAPEQVRRRGAYADTRSDVYALGALLFGFCTGRSPYRTDGSVEESIHNIVNETPARPSAINRFVNAELEAVVLKSLSKDPERRYQSADALATDLRRFLKGDPIEAKADSAWYMLRKTARRHRAPIGVALVIAGLVLIFGGVALSQRVEIAAQRDAALAASRRSDVGRGRVLARDGSGLIAERLIWPAFLHDGGALQSVASDDPPTSLSYWALWELYSHHPCLASARVGDSPVERIRCNDAGSIAATCHADGRIRFWTLPDLAPAGVIDSGDHRPLDISFTSGPSDARTIGRDGRIVTWRETRAVEAIEASAGPLVDASFSPDGEMIALLLDDGSATLVDARLGEAIARSPRIGPRPERIWLGGRGVLAVRCLSDDKEVRAIHVFHRRGSQLAPLGAGGRKGFSACAVGPEGRVVKGSGDGKIVLHASSAARSGGARSGYAPSLAGVKALAINGDGSILVSGGRGRLLRMWDMESKRFLAGMAGHAGRIKHLVFAGRRDMIVSVDSEGVIKAWDSAPLLGMRRLEGHGETITQVRFDPAGGRVLSTGYDGAIRVWSTRDGEMIEVWTPEGHEEGINAANLSPDGETLATSGHRETRDVHIRSARSGAPVSTSEREHRAWVSWIEFTPDGETVASASRDGVMLHDVDTGEHRATLFEHLPRPKAVCFSPDGSMMVCLSANGRVEAVGLPDSTRRLWATRLDGRRRCMAISPDGSTLAIAGQRAVIHLLDAQTGEVIGALEGHERSIFDVAFHPSGRLLASGARDGSIKVWDVQRRFELITLDDHERGVFALAFSPDGGTLASGGEDNILRIWDLEYYRRHIAGNRVHQASLRALMAAPE